MNNRGCEETYKKIEMSEHANRLRSISRIQGLNTPYEDSTIAYFSVPELQTIIKRDFYFVSVKYICARNPKKTAIDLQLAYMTKVLTRARGFIESKPRQMTNVPATAYEIVLKDPFMIRLLRAFLGVDEILLLFLGATLEGSIENELRSSHYLKFKSMFNCLKVIASFGDNFFLQNGDIRDMPEQLLSSEQLTHLKYLKSNGNYYGKSKSDNNLQPQKHSA